MQVEGAVSRSLEDRRRQDQPIGHDHRGVGVKRPEAFQLLGVLQPFRCAQGEPRRFSCGLDGRFAQSHAAAGAARRLGINASDLVARFEDRAKARHGEIGRAHEDDAHR